MNSKQPNPCSHVQNWHWPERTWFRERLQAVKSSQQEQRRKPLVNSQTATLEKPEGPDKTPKVKAY